MQGAARASRSREQHADVLLEWTVHLARLNPGKTIRASIALFAASILVGVVWGGIVSGAVAFALLFLSASEYFLPVRFSLSSEGISARGIATCRRILWQNVRRVLSDDDGMKVCPLRRPSRLEPFRGVYLRLPSHDPAFRERVHQIIFSHAHDLQTGKPPA
jgi:hypothetical protein